MPKSGTIKTLPEGVDPTLVEFLKQNKTELEAKSRTADFSLVGIFDASVVKAYTVAMAQGLAGIGSRDGLAVSCRPFPKDVS